MKGGENMSKCSPYYTKADTDNDKCYHNNTECPSGKMIKKENRASGTGNRHLCEICKSMK